MDLRQDIEEQTLPSWRKQQQETTAWQGLKQQNKNGIRLKWSQLGEEQKHLCLPDQWPKA